MQNTAPTPVGAPANWINTYGLFVLSVLAILLVGFAWLFARVDASTAIDVIIAVLAGNGLVTATMWQAAPGLISQFQQILGQFASHIQALHAQQVAQPLSQIATTKVPAVQAPVPPTQPTLSKVAQQPFPPASPSSSLLGVQSTPLNTQSWLPSSSLRTGSGG